VLGRAKKKAKPTSAPPQFYKDVKEGDVGARSYSAKRTIREQLPLHVPGIKKKTGPRGGKESQALESTTGSSWVNCEVLTGARPKPGPTGS